MSEKRKSNPGPSRKLPVSNETSGRVPAAAVTNDLQPCRDRTRSAASIPGRTAARSGAETAHRKPSDPVYANAGAASNRGREEPPTRRQPNEPDRSSRATKKLPRPRAIYCNVDSVPLAAVVNASGQSSTGYARGPVYANWPPSRGSSRDRDRPSPASSSYSELRRATDRRDNDNDDGSSQTSNVYESIYEPIDDVIRPPTVLSSTYPKNRRSKNLTAQENNAKVKSLTDLTKSMSVKGGNKSSEKEYRPLNWFCSKCNEKLREEGLGCRTMDTKCHLQCFTCVHCGDKLGEKQFHRVDNQPYCNEVYKDTLEKCTICQKEIWNRILRANRRSYHPHCFRCVVCFSSLVCIPFTVDTYNQIYCIDDFHKKFAPRCSVCRFPIAPEIGETQAVRYVALDRSFHVQCFKCEDCNVLLGSKDEGRRRCYPLDGHLLCNSCNVKKIQALTSEKTTSF